MRQIRSLRTVLLLTGAVLTGAVSAAPAAQAQPLEAGDSPAAVASAGVVVNGRKLIQKQLFQLKHRFRLQAAPGQYWYDRKCGAWGLVGVGTMGFLPAGLNLGGRLWASASSGTSGVFINGRELALPEVAFLQRYTPVIPGRYWLDARGNVGREGSGRRVLNLRHLIGASGRRGRGGGGGRIWRSKITDITVVSGGGFVGVSGKGWSVSR